MEERENKNIKGELLKEVIEKCNFEPNSNYMLLTVNEYESENGLEIVSEQDLTLDEWQYVVAAGPAARYKAGDKVYLNLKKLVRREPNPNDRLSYIEKIDIQPFMFEDYILTFIDDNAILGKEKEFETVDIKA